MGNFNCVLYCIVLIICFWRRVSDFNPTFALAADYFLLVSEYINCIALLCLSKICTYVSHAPGQTHGFHPHRCNDKGIGPLKLKILQIFGQNVEYKRPAGAYPFCDFHKICRICTSFQDALAVKVSLNFLKGLWSYGHFNLTGSGCPQIFSAP